MGASPEMFERVYQQLRVLAERHFRNQPASVTLQPTALVHEVYVRMVRGDAASIHDREHFMAVASTAMRQILVDQARRRHAAKRGGNAQQITLSDVSADPANQNDVTDVLTVDRLITQLNGLSPRQAKVVELRAFAGMTMPEVARVLGVAVATVEKDWRQARAWMRVKLQGGLEP